MAVSLLQHWLDHYDPIHRGFTPKGIANGVCATCGFFFPRIRGGYTLYRGAGGEVDYDMAVGASGPTDSIPTRIRNFPTYPLSAATAYSFGLRAISPGGAEEENIDLVAHLTTGGDSVPADPVPNPPIRLSAVPVAGGNIRLRWYYEPAGEGAPVYQYNVYHDNGGGSINYVTPLATTRQRSYLTAAYSHGIAVKFTVRAESRAGDEETNTNEATATADAQGPPDAGGLTIAEGVET